MIMNDEIDHGRPFDWGLASKDYSKYRDIYPELFYKKITEMGLCVKGQNVLDLGTGTGVLPRNMYKYGANFTGADISPNQIAEAKKLSEVSGMDIKYVVSSAEDIDFAAGSFDVVTACQCFMYFNKDTAMPKIHGVLKEGGHFCVLFMSWLPDESAIAKRSEELVLKYNPLWTGAGMKRHEPETYSDSFFEVENAETYDLKVPFTRESWHGRMKACRGMGASSLSPEVISKWEKEHKEYLETVPEAFDIIHFVSILNLRKR